MPFESHVVAFGRQRLADGVRSVPRVTSGSQKTGCPNRGLALGLGPAWPAPGGRRTLRSAQRTRGLTGRTGNHLRLILPLSTAPRNCLASTRLIGSPRGPALSGGQGCPTPPRSLNSYGRVYRAYTSRGSQYCTGFWLPRYWSGTRFPTYRLHTSFSAGSPTNPQRVGLSVKGFTKASSTRPGKFARVAGIHFDGR